MPGDSHQATVIPSIWFYFYNLLVVIFAAPHFSQDRFTNNQPWPAAIFGLTLQATLLAIWLGASGSPMWKRGLVFALSFFYFGYYLHNQTKPPSMYAACPLGIGILVAALAVATVRAAFCRLTGTSALRQISIKDLFSGTAAVAFALAIWGGPMRVYLIQRYKFAIEEFAAQYAWCIVEFVALTLIIALPIFFRQSKLRRRAFIASAVIFPVYYLLINRSAIDPIPDLSKPLFRVAFLLAFYWSIVVSTKIALKQWGIDLVRPIEKADGSDAQ